MMWPLARFHCTRTVSFFVVLVDGGRPRLLLLVLNAVRLGAVYTDCLLDIYWRGQRSSCSYSGSEERYLKEEEMRMESCGMRNGKWKTETLKVTTNLISHFSLQRRRLNRNTNITVLTTLFLLNFCAIQFSFLIMKKKIMGGIESGIAGCKCILTLLLHDARRRGDRYGTSLAVVSTTAAAY